MAMPTMMPVSSRARRRSGEGAQVAAQARGLRPDLKVLFTTGYARNAIVRRGRLDPGVHLLTKPFNFEELAIKVRDVLDRR
jgi:CheY-like chemotaxis protein